MPITLVQPDGNKITVIVRTATRQKEGNLKYETVGSFDVAGSTPVEVLNFLKTSVARQSQAK